MRARRPQHKGGKAGDVIRADRRIVVKRQDEIQAALIDCELLDASRVRERPFHVVPAPGPREASLAPGIEDSRQEWSPTLSTRLHHSAPHEFLSRRKRVASPQSSYKHGAGFSHTFLSAPYQASRPRADSIELPQLALFAPLERECTVSAGRSKRLARFCRRFCVTLEKVNGAQKYQSRSRHMIICHR
jgi:hypothetical protein